MGSWGFVFCSFQRHNPFPFETEKRGEQFHADILQMVPPHLLHQDAGDASKANRPINRADRAALRWLDAMR
jgi:hypothetical protein